MSNHQQLATALHGSQEPAMPSSLLSWRRWLLPLCVLVLLLSLCVALWDRLIPAPSVVVVRIAPLQLTGVAQVETAATRSEPEVAFQAAGWLEPDPFPIRATALVNGVVTSVSVTDGQYVTAGDELARLDQEEFLLAVRHAEADVAAAAAQLRQTQQQLPLLQAQREQVLARIQAQEALVAELTDFARRRLAAPTVYSEGDIRRAVFRQENAEHMLVAEQQALKVWQQEFAAAQTAVVMAEAHVTQQELFLQHAQLNLQRTIIRSPIDGMVMRLHAVPGRKQMLMSDSPLSTTVAELFDPMQVQVRVDVPLADAGGLVVGQHAHITSNLLPDMTLTGEVTRIEGHADLTRNTLQAQVRVTQPDRRLRPEMLMRVQFFALPQENESSKKSTLATAASRIVGAVPEEFVANRQGDSWQAWLVDGENRLQPVTLRLGVARGGLVPVFEGAPVGAWLVLNPSPDVYPGMRIQPVPQEMPGGDSHE